MAAAAGPVGQVLVDLLHDRPGGFVGYALCSDDIGADPPRMRGEGLEVVGPFPLSRIRPDARRLSWELAFPHGMPWCSSWPFLIEWHNPDAERLAWEPPDNHPNTAIGCRTVTVAMAPGIDDRRLYHHQLGLAPDASDQYRLNDLRIQTLSVLSQMIGVVELGIEVRDLAAGTVLLASDVFERVDKSAVHIKPGASFGAALVLERGSARLVVISSRAAANAWMLDLAAGQGGGWCAIREWWPRASTGTPCQTGR